MGPALDDFKVHVKIKLSALWATVMFCYVYGDYFDLYTPGKLQSMLQGRIGPLGPATEKVLLGTSILMAIPSLMVFLSIALRPAINRWLNVVLGSVYTVIMLLIAIHGGFVFYVFLAMVEVVLTSLIVWYAWRWPKRAVSAV